MVKKRLSVLLILVMLIAQYTYGLGVPIQVKAEGNEENISVSEQVYSTDVSTAVYGEKPTVTETVYAPQAIESDILTSVTLTVYGPDGQVNPGPVYDLKGSSVQLDYTWALPNGHGYHDGDYFTFDMPAQFKLFNDISGFLVSDGGNVGSFTISQATHTVVMTFNGYIEDHDNVRGTLKVNTQFDEKIIVGSTTQEILIPINGEVQVFTLIFKPSGATIEKKGVPPGFNASSIDWTIDVNKSLDTVKAAKVTDPLPAGLLLSTSDLAVYKLSVALDGTATRGDLVDPVNYTADITNGTLTLQFNSTINSGYRIEYKTAITNEKIDKFTNTATFSGEDNLPASSTATVTVKRGGSFDKFVVKYDSAKQIIDWAINYNYNEKIIAQENAYFTDLFNDTQTLVAGSLKVYPVTLDSAGTATKGPELSAAAYSITPVTEPGKKGFKLQFNSGVSSPYRIEYKTQSTIRILQKTTITNTVTDSTYSDSATQVLTPSVISKSLFGVNYQEKLAKWDIIVNSDNYPMDNVVVKDEFPFGGLEFFPNSLEIRNGGGQLVSPSEYTLDYDENNPSVFTVTFHSRITGKYIISYIVEFNFYTLTGNADKFHNTATVTWKDPELVEHTDTATGVFDPRNDVKNNGSKSGSYNAATKGITWTVGVNYNGKTIDDAIMKDLIKAPLNLKENSVKVYHMKIAGDGTPSLGSEVNKTLYSLSTEKVGTGPLQDTQLEVKLGKINSPYYIVFTTSLEGQLLGPKVENKANLYDGTQPASKDLTASVTIRYGGEPIDKTGVQIGDKIKWTVPINRAQSYIKNAVITDTPTPNQILLPDSFHLYKTSVSATGEVTTTTSEWEKGADKDYTLEIQMDSNGQQSFVLKFNKDISTASVLEYQTLITAKNGEEVTNTAKLTGDNVVTVTKEVIKRMIVGVSSGSGTGSGERSTLTVKKVDENNNTVLLSGAKFNLYRVNGTERLLLDTQTTEIDGTAVFRSILSGSYILVEISAPEGYVLDSQERPVTLNPGASIEVVVANKAIVTPSPSPETPSPSPGTPSSSPGAPTETPIAASPTPTPTPTAPTPTTSTIPGEVVIIETAVPAGPGDSGIQPTASPADEELPIDEEIPLGNVDVIDDEVPAGTVAQLPKTGEASPMPLYMAGMALILGGFILNRVFNRKRSE